MFQLRLFQTLTDISSENSSTVILPVPMDLFRPYLSGQDGRGDRYASKPPQEHQRRGNQAERAYEQVVSESTEREGSEER